MRRPALRLRPPVLRQTEAQLQAAIVEALRWHRFEVQVTVHQYRRQACPRCAWTFWPTGGYGASKATGDLLVRRPSWPWWARVEGDVKTDRGRLSPEQQERVAAGALRIWRSVDAALADARQADEALAAMLTGAASPEREPE